MTMMIMVLVAYVLAFGEDGHGQGGAAAMCPPLVQVLPHVLVQVGEGGLATERDDALQLARLPARHVPISSRPGTTTRQRSSMSDESGCIISLPACLPRSLTREPPAASSGDPPS